MSSKGAVPPPETEQLLNVINTQQRYNDFKRFLLAVRIVRDSTNGPFYYGLPTWTNPLDRYDPDLALLEQPFMHTYARFLHACLTKQYPLGEQTIPRLTSGRALDRRAVNVFFAPFAPSLSRNVSDSVVSLWDRNATKLMSTGVASAVRATGDSLFFTADRFQKLIPLTLDYYREGSRSPLMNNTGIQLDRNTIVVLRYIAAFLASANDYRDKLRDVARIVNNTDTLRRKREQLVRDLSRVQREKQQELNESTNAAGLSVAQSQLVREFRVVYRQTVQRILATASKPPAGRPTRRQKRSLF